MATPPPANGYSELPEYYLGKLLYYDADGTDNCRWVVYDGNAKVRCTTRKAALDYIAHTTLPTSDNSHKLALGARMDVNHACHLLDKASTYAVGPTRLLLERLSARLRPFIVDLDNLLIT